MGVLTFKGATAKEPLASENIALVPKWAAKRGLRREPVGRCGRQALRRRGLHQLPHLQRRRRRLPGAPNLTAEGSKNKGIAFQIAHLKCPACKNPGSPMPTFQGLGDVRLKQIATFLEASKGPKK